MRKTMGKVGVCLVLAVAFTLFVLPVTIVSAPAVTLDQLLKMDPKYQQLTKDAENRKAELSKQYQCAKVYVGSGRYAKQEIVCKTKEDCIQGCKNTVTTCIHNGTDKCYGRTPIGQKSFSLTKKTYPTETQAKACIERMKPECEKTVPKCEEGCKNLQSFPPK